MKIDNLLSELDAIIKNPKTAGPQGGEEKDALIERIKKNNFESDELKQLSIEIINRLFKLRMELEIKNANLETRLRKFEK